MNIEIENWKGRNVIIDICLPVRALFWRRKLDAKQQFRRRDCRHEIICRRAVVKKAVQIKFSAFVGYENIRVYEIACHMLRG